MDLYSETNFVFLIGGVAKGVLGEGGCEGCGRPGQ